MDRYVLNCSGQEIDDAPDSVVVRVRDVREAYSSIKEFFSSEGELFFVSQPGCYQDKDSQGKAMTFQSEVYNFYKSSAVVTAVCVGNGERYLFEELMDESRPVSHIQRIIVDVSKPTEKLTSGLERIATEMAVQNPARRYSSNTGWDNIDTERILERLMD